MKFSLNRLRLRLRNRRSRHHAQNPNPDDTVSPSMTLVSGSGDGREDEDASSSTAKSTEAEDIGYESAESHGTVSFSATEIEDQQEGNHSGTVEEENRRELEDASSKSLVVANTENALMRMEKPPADDCCPICFSNFVVPCRGPCGHWYCVKLGAFVVIVQHVVMCVQRWS